MMYHYRIELVKALDKSDFLERLNALGAHDMRVVQILSYAEYKAESEDDKGFYTGEILVEAKVDLNLPGGV